MQIEKPTNSDKITDEQRKIINGASHNARILFEEIKVMGPEGKPRDPLPTISFTIL